MKGEGLSRSHLAGGVVGVLSQLGVHAVQADHVGDVPNGETSFVQDGDDAFMRLLHKIHDDLVVKVINLQTTTMTLKSEVHAEISNFFIHSD